MKRIVAATVALCMLLMMCMPAFAEDYAAVVENKFKWGISLNEYISAYNLADYETAYNGDASAIVVESSYNDEEYAYFLNDQFVMSVTYFYYPDENKVAELKGNLTDIFGYCADGGAERMYNALNAIAPGSFSSPDEFGECFYAEIPEKGYVGYVCNYFDSPGVGDHYWVLIANEALLYSIAGIEAPAIPAEEISIESQFKWGIGIDEYIAEYSVTDYDIQQLSDKASILHERIDENTFEDSIFVNGQYVGGVYDCWDADEATVNDLVVALEALFGTSEEGGEKYIFNTMELIAPGKYTSPAEFKDCVYARNKDRIYGFVCSYTPGSYVLMIMNTGLLRSLMEGETAPAEDSSVTESEPLDEPSIGGGLGSGDAASTESDGFSIGGGLTPGNAASEDNASSESGELTIGGGF